MRWVKKVLKVAAYSSLGVVIALSAGQVVHAVYSPKIEDKQSMERLVEEEKDKLNCHKNIESRLVSEPFVGTKRIRKDRYRVTLGGFYKKESVLKHEVYHACDGHLEIEGEGRFLLLLFYEIQAMVYQFFDLRL